MHVTYRARLRRDIAAWSELGFIDDVQRHRIERHSLSSRLGPPGQVALIACASILALAALAAFTTAFGQQWFSGLALSGRLAVPATVTGATLFASCLLDSPGRATPAIRIVLSDTAATVALGAASATMAVAWNALHVPSDPHGSLKLLALAGLATAVVARSTGAALASAAALLVGTFLTAVPLPGSLSPADVPASWAIGLGLAAACLTGRLRAPTPVLSILLLAVSWAVSARLSAAPVPMPEAFLCIALAGLGLGFLASGFPPLGSERVATAGEVLARAAATAGVAGILGASLYPPVTLHTSSSIGLAVPCLAAACAFIVLAPRILRRGALPIGHAGVAIAILASGLTLLHAPDQARPDTSIPFRLLWGGVAPLLGIAVAAHADGRRILLGAALLSLLAPCIAIASLPGVFHALAGDLLVLSCLFGLALFASRRFRRQLARIRTP